MTATKRGNLAKKNKNTSEVQSVKFHYLKGPDFRSIHIDGAIGGLTSKGFLHIALFAERAPIPQEVTLAIMPDGQLGDEIVEERETKEGIIRQMEVDVIVNENTAKELRNWLDERLQEFEERRRQIEQLRKERDNHE